GMATNIPPHNLTEIVDATIALVNNPTAQLAEILKFVQGPDFPTAGIIHGKSGIFEAYRTGRGRFVMRAKAAIENLTKDRQAIVVTEIPYQVNKAKLVERMAQLVNDKVIEDISDIRDESDRDGMRIVVELNRGDARENLVAYFGGKKIDINTTGRAPKPNAESPFTAIQADAILELQLHRLTKLSIDEISKELASTRDNIAEYESILGSEKKLRGVIIKELEEVKKQY